MPRPNKFESLAEAARITGIPYNRLRMACKLGVLKHKKSGRTVLVAMRDIRDYPTKGRASRKAIPYFDTETTNKEVSTELES